jgi:hypothetical protein
MRAGIGHANQNPSRKSAKRNKQGDKRVQGVPPVKASRRTTRSGPHYPFVSGRRREVHRRPRSGSSYATSILISFGFTASTLGSRTVRTPSR